MKDIVVQVEKNNITFSLREEHKESMLAAIKQVGVDILGFPLWHPSVKRNRIPFLGSVSTSN